MDILGGDYLLPYEYTFDTSWPKHRFLSALGFIISLLIQAEWPIYAAEI